MIDEIKITSLSGRGSVSMQTGDYSSYWLGPVDWGEAQGNHNTYRYHSQVGSSIVSTTVQERSLSVTGWVIDAGDNSLEGRCEFLNSFISPVEDYTLECKGKKIQFRPDSSIIYSPEHKKNNEKIRRFLIQATCPFPLFSDCEETKVTFNQTKKLFRFPTDFGMRSRLVFGEKGDSQRMTATNNGGFSTGFTATIRFSGEVRGPVIHNLTTGKLIGVNRTFAAGDRLKISTVAGEKGMTLYRESGEEVNVIKNRMVRSSFDTQLLPGDNIIIADCAEESQRPSMDVTLSYTPLYLEVE